MSENTPSKKTAESNGADSKAGPSKAVTARPKDEQPKDEPSKDEPSKAVTARPKAGRVGVRSGREWTAGWKAFAGVAIPLVSTFAGVRIRNGEKLPRDGAFILAPNHYTNADPIIVGITMWKLGRVPRFLLKASLLRIPVFGAILRSLGMVGVERAGRGGAGALSAAIEHLRGGDTVIIYPEGTLTREPDMWPMRGKSGVVRAALESGAPVIPMAHWGAQKIIPRFSSRVRLFPRTVVDVIVGDPVDLSEWRGKPLDAATLTGATNAVMDAITALVEQLRGETAPTSRWDPAEHGQSEFGHP